MSKPVPRSRLNISYRTKIDGKPKKAKLPMRFLVLGDFTGNDRRLLGERPVHSVMPGMKLDTFMQEMKLSAPIDDPALRETLTGDIAGAVTGKLTRKLSAADTSANVKFSGTGTVSGDLRVNGLGSFAGEVLISGEFSVPAANGQITIPDGGLEVTLSVFGKVEPPTGGEVGVTGDVDGAIKLKLLANDLRDDDTAIDLRSRVTGDAVPVQITIPIRSLADFKPLHLAASVPEIRRLVLLHRLVLEARNFISSFPELREVIKAELATAKATVAGDPAIKGDTTEIGKLREALRVDFPQLIVDAAAR